MLRRQQPAHVVLRQGREPAASMRGQGTAQTSSCTEECVHYDAMAYGHSCFDAPCAYAITLPPSCSELANPPLASALSTLTAR